MERKKHHEGKALWRKIFCLMAAREAKRSEERVRARYTLQRHTPATCFL
jgi:hypothetical protein